MWPELWLQTSKFLSQLDVLSEKLLKLFEKRGGQIGRKLQHILAHMAQVRELFGGKGNTAYL